jgi:hypothetical protein
LLRGRLQELGVSKCLEKWGQIENWEENYILKQHSVLGTLKDTVWNIQFKVWIFTSN